ncbi:condensation domain-containing protein, partial [Streptomyces sp. NPDC127574]|uniref:condensation domain-containing protein n=1 Tax=Streptomyces sp. NPDC127574 TaxID=3345401 RepID=UPI00362E6BE6
AAFVERADGEPLQVIPTTVPLPWQHLDLTAHSAQSRVAAFEEFLHQDRRAPFDITTPPLLRIALIDLEPGRAELVLTAHHALSDHHHLGLTDIQRPTGLPALFDTLVVFESYPVDEQGLSAAGEATGGLTVTGLRHATGTNYPLTLMALVEPHLQLTLQYARAVFDRDTVKDYAARLVRVLARLADSPDLPADRLDNLAPDQRERQLVDFNDTDAPTPP